MSPSARNFALTTLLILFGGGLLGYVYDRWLFGALIAALALLAWHGLQLVRFEKASRSKQFDSFQYGDGIWQQIASRFRFERGRAKRRKRQYRELLREIRKSTNAMPDGAVILNTNNEIVTCNRAVRGLAGIKQKVDRGQKIDNIIRDPLLTRLLEGKLPDDSVEIASPVNDEAWLNCRLVPYGLEQRLLMIRDVSERYKLGKIRRDFVANASHELRSPLTVIGGYLEALSEDDALPDAWHQPVAQMRRQSSRMNQIVAELMELSRLEGVAAPTLDQKVDVAQLLLDAQNSVEGVAGKRAVVIESAADTQLLGSYQEIESVIGNLLSNAVKHTAEDGSITLSWSVNDSGAAELSITDNGVGIEAQHIPRLTERFYRVDRGRSRESGGIGLGLAIVKHVVTRHGGELHIESEVGQGSQFRCVFPAERLADA